MKSTKKQRVKKTFAKVTTLTLALTLFLTPTGAFALDAVDETGKAFKEFTQDGVTYYDIYNGQTEGRPDATDVDQMIQQVLYEKKDGQSHSAAEYWAAMAASIFASNPSSWRENGEEGNHGADKDAGDYKDRLTADPGGEKNNKYGNVQKWLASKSGGEDDSDNGSKYRKNDVNLKASGMMTAQSLAEVEDMAFQYLVDVNPGKIKTSHFDSHNSLKGMNEESSAGDVIYHLMAMRDRVGGTFEYEFNCFGIAYYDFQAIPFTGKEGEGLTTALKGYDNLDDAEGETISGFEYNSSSDTHIDRTRNESTEDISKTISSEWSSDEELSSEITTLKGMTFGQEESAEFTFGDDTAFFHATAGFTFTEEELFQEGLNTTNSATQHDGGGTETNVTIPAHMALEQMALTTKTDSKSRYDCPVMITYKVAIFSYNGGYYDDNSWTTYFNTAGYEQRSFMTIFGNNTDGAVESLRNCMAKDAGYDSSYRTTRGIREKHASNDDAYWDTPWVNHLDYSKMKSAANTIGISPSYDEASEALSKNQPISITGGVLARQATTTDSIVGDAVQVYPLTSVTLAKAQRDLITMKEDEDLHLRNIAVEAWDSQGVYFHKFIYTDGYWILVNKNGEPIESAKAVKLYQNKNGDYVVRAAAPGRAYVKYMIPENAYYYLNAADAVVTIEPEEVDTPTITITVKENTDVPTKIVAPEQVDLYYHGPDDPDDPDEPVKIDIEDVDGLEAVVYNQKGNVMEVKPEWEAASDAEGIKIKDGKLIISKDGDYRLQAVYEELVSDPVDIHVEKRALTQIQVPAEPVNVVYAPGEGIDMSAIEGLTAVALDQTGAVVEGVEIVWKEDSDGIGIEDGKLMVSAEGTYTLTAEGGGLTSSPVSLVCSLDPAYAEVAGAVNTFLSCGSEYTSMAEACLFVKNKLGQQSTVNEVIFTEVLLQLAGAQGSTDEQKEYELQAVIWAIQNELLSSAQGQTLTIGGGITQLQMATLAYNAAVKFGKDVSCEDVIGAYAGSETLTEEQRTVMNWAISKGALSDAEEAARTLDVSRLVTDAELDAYNVALVKSPEVDESDMPSSATEKTDGSSQGAASETGTESAAEGDETGGADESAADESAAAGDETTGEEAAESDGDQSVTDEDNDGIYESASGEKTYISDEGTYVEVEAAEDGTYIGDTNGDGVIGGEGDYVYTPDGAGGFTKEIYDGEVPADGGEGDADGDAGAALWIVLILAAAGAGAAVVILRKKKKTE